MPVDSEHSALAQAMRGERRDEVRRLIVTASGGPFRGRTRAELADVTPEQAMAHPTWDMGPVITINSATLVNKGLEVIEANLLFDIAFDRIDVVVHPQSIVHSMVEFIDGSTIAQASPPDMKLPIALGLAWPDRVPDAAAGCDWTQPATWEFFPLDDEAFPAVSLARKAGTFGRYGTGGVQRRQRGLRRGVRRRATWTSSASSTRWRVVLDEHLGDPDAARQDTDRRRRARRRRMGPQPGRGAGLEKTMNALIYTLGVVVFFLGLASRSPCTRSGTCAPPRSSASRSPQYFVGFGHTVWSVRRGETEYGIKAIPLGGYVKLVGMLPPAKDADPHERPQDQHRPVHAADRRRPGGRVRARGGQGPRPALLPQAVVAEADHHGRRADGQHPHRGRAVQRSCSWAFGALKPPTTVDDGLRLRDHAAEARAHLHVDATPITPAQQAGLHPGDAITSFNGTKITTWDQVTELIRDNGAGDAAIGIERDGVSDDAHRRHHRARHGPRPRRPRPRPSRSASSASRPTQSSSGRARASSRRPMGRYIKGTGEAIAAPAGADGRRRQGRLRRESATRRPDERRRRQPGRRRVVTSTTRRWAERVAALLVLLAGLNLFLALFNFIPLLPLDGGHIAGALYEAVRRGVAQLRGRPDPGYVDVAKLLPVAYAVRWSSS